MPASLTVSSILPIFYRCLRSSSAENLDEVDYVTCGYVYGDSTCGQRAVYQLGMTGVPIVNVNNK